MTIMKFSIGIAAVMLLASDVALAAPVDVCSGDARLRQFQGVWADSRLVDSIRTSRSWNAALREVDAQSASVLIRGATVSWNLAWHEGDNEVGRCVRAEGNKLWRLPMKGRIGKPRSLVRVAERIEDEGDFYLRQMFAGCFASDHGERWCLNGKSISIDSRRLGAALQLDLSEGPLYGTPVKIEGLVPPFLVFVPHGDGWEVFQDDFASVEGRVPVDPEHSTPWRVLRRVDR